jgi:DNA-directed RNA polymerase delta subunit
LIIPSSLFFTSLGSPEKIIIERENETIQLYDLVYSFMSNLGMDDDEMNEMVTKLKRINTYQKYTFQ